MTNFSIQFTYPWFLLLLIPALFFSLFPYFRMAKKYRRTRNHIISVVLHTTAMVLCIFVFSGMHFDYQTINSNNEVFLLVDVSYSGRETQEKKNEFVQSVLDSGNSEYKVGIITFGYGQTYAAELSTNAEKTYESYEDSLRDNKPDDSATDIAAAVSFARTHIKHPKTAKLVILSDGIETDGEALAAIKAAAADGIRVDTVSFTDEKEIPDAQIVGAVMPDYNVSAKSEVKLGVTVPSSVAQTAQITLRDNDGEEETTEVSLEPGVQTFEIAHTFAEQGLHRLSFDLSFKEPVEIEDAVEANNEYSSYLYMEVFDDILIVEGFEGEAEKLQELLKEEYTLTVLNVAEAEKFPKTLDEMRLYDQVVLANVSHSDMPAGFEDLLNSYVKDIGGGLFTVGGSEPDGDEAHAYNRKDLYGTTYQDMLPVIAEDYTPPLGVVIIIDCSGSMSDVLENAKAGARACLNAMTERDYCGVIALDDDYKEALALTPVTREYEIVAAIDNIGNGGGTLLTPSLKRAGDSLKAQTNIEKRHIIVVSDCMFSDNVEKYGSVLQSNFEAGITISVVGINTSADSEKAGREIVKLGNGGSDDDSEEEAEKWKSKYHHTVTGEDLSSIMREDLTVPDIKEVEAKPFVPTIRVHNAVVSGVEQANMPRLNGYYGTKIKEDAEIVLAGEFVPIYAQWKYGEGMVGSFMCDLSGKWSSEFLSDETGQRIIKNIIGVLFPKENIRAQDIEIKLTEKNYGNVLNVYTDMEEGERIELQIFKDSEPKPVQTIKPTEKEGYTQIPFTITEPGVYELVVKKKDATGKDVSEATIYKAFSYSQEYNTFVEADEETSVALLEGMASAGKGKRIETESQVFEGLIKKLSHTFDPRLAFVIVSIVLVLLDIAVRKFKFKWLHEIIRERKEKQELGKQAYRKE